jgi:hypothetical protein
MKPPMIALFITVVVLTAGSSAFQPTNKLIRPVSGSRGSFHLTPKIEDARNTVSIKSKEGDEFWSLQKELMQEMTGRAEKSLKEEQREKFARRRNALVADTAIFTSLIFSLLWFISSNPFVSFSYALGATFGLAYSYGLGKYVETIGGSIDDAGELQGAGIGQARFAFLILLFLFVGKLTLVIAIRVQRTFSTTHLIHISWSDTGKFRSQGLIEIPSIAGFFTYQVSTTSEESSSSRYRPFRAPCSLLKLFVRRTTTSQLASLSQGMREFND